LKHCIVDGLPHHTTIIRLLFYYVECKKKTIRIPSIHLSIRFHSKKPFSNWLVFNFFCLRKFHDVTSQVISRKIKKGWLDFEHCKIFPKIDFSSCILNLTTLNIKIHILQSTIHVLKPNKELLSVFIKTILYIYITEFSTTRKKVVGFTKFL